MSHHQNRSSIHDCMFFFRFPSRGTSQSSNVSNNASQDLENSPNSEKKNSLLNSRPRYLYGYVFNRQRQDERLKRGGEQKSVVILSYSPYSSVFKPLLKILGSLCFDIGKKALEPIPVLGNLMELPIGNANLKVYLPSAHSLLSESGMPSDEFISMMAPFPPSNQSIPQGLLLLSTLRLDEFLESLSARGPGKFLSKRMKANWLDLYRRFLKGHNFMPWFQRRRAIAEQEQHRLWRQARMRTEIKQFISKMSELEIIDSFNAIERHLLGEIQSGKDNTESALTCQKLKGDLQTVFNALPKDMQQLLLFNPQRAALLQGSMELTKPSVQVEVVSQRDVSTMPR